MQFPQSRNCIENAGAKARFLRCAERVGDMKRQRYTYHNGNPIDITDDTRPTCWETSGDLPFRVVKDSYSELLVYVYHVLMLTSVSSSLKNPHVNFAALLMHLISMHCKLQGIPLFMPKDRGED